MQTQIHADSWMIALGIISPDPKLYENKVGKDLMGEYRPRFYANTLPKECRNKLRKDIKERLERDMTLKGKQLFVEFVSSGLMPKRDSGQYLTAHAFYEYVKRCRKDLQAGITDEEMIKLHQSGSTIKDIAAKFNLSWHTVEDRLICNNIIQGI